MTKHIFIGGSSFSGSTLVSLILGSLPDVANINESHWLISHHARSSKSLSTKVEISNENSDEFTHCRLCGVDCAYWDIDFRRSLQRDKSQWIEKLSDRINSDIIVTADKSLGTLRSLSDQKNFNCDMLILFKDPWRFLRSWMGRKNKLQNPQKALDYWSRTYEELLNCSTVGKKIVVGLGELQNDPHWALKAMCDEFDLKYDSKAIQYWEKEQHYIGGNFNVYDKLSEIGPQAMEIRPISNLEYDEHLDEIVKNHGWSQKIYKRLYEERLYNSESVMDKNLLPAPIPLKALRKSYVGAYSQLYHLAYKIKNR